MSDLKELVARINEYRGLAQTDLDTVPWQTRASVASMIIGAREELAKLESDYASRIRQNSIGILLAGDVQGVNNYVGVAVREAGAALVQADSVYRELADRIFPSLGPGNEFGPTQLSMLHVALEKHMDRLGILQMRMPRLEGFQATPDVESLTGYIRQLIRAAVGDDLVKTHLDKAVNERAIATHFSSKVLPVLVTGLADRQEMEAVAPLFSNTAYVNVGTAEDVTEKYVLDSLTGIRKAVSSKKKN